MIGIVFELIQVKPCDGVCSTILFDNFHLRSALLQMVQRFKHEFAVPQPRPVPLAHTLSRKENDVPLKVVAAPQAGLASPYPRFELHDLKGRYAPIVKEYPPSPSGRSTVPQVCYLNFAF